MLLNKRAGDLSPRLLAARAAAPKSGSGFTVILPPMPAFYNHPQNLTEMVDHIVFRTLDQFGIHLSEAKRWEGMKQEK